MIIGGEADFWSRKPISKEERVRLMRRLKEYVNLSYDSEATIAAQIGVDEGALNGWLVGKVKLTFTCGFLLQSYQEHLLDCSGS